MKKNISTYNILTVFCLFCFTTALHASDYPLVKAVVNPEKATVGTLLKYRINIAGKGVKKEDIEILLPGEKICYPEKKEDDNAAKDDTSEPKPEDQVPLYMIHNAKKDDRSEEDMLDITVVLEMSFYRPGSYSLPDVEIRYAGNEKVGYEVPVVTIEEVNQQGTMEDIEPPLALGGNYTRLILLIAGIIVLTLAAVFIVRAVLKRRQEKLNAVPPVPPLEIFLRDLAKLDAGKLIADNKVEEYVFGISMVFRKYLSSLLSIDATEMTSDEIDHLLKKVMGGDLYSRYHDVMMQSFHLWDLSKFAEFTPSREILTANLEKTEKLARNLFEEMNSDPDRI